MTPRASRAAAAVVIPVAPDGDVLVIRRTATCPKYPLHWNFPGGYINAGEGMVAGALRELREETGLRARREDLRLEFAYRAGPLIAVFTVPVSFKFAPRDHDKEHDMYAWVPLHRLPYPATDGALFVAQRVRP